MANKRKRPSATGKFTVKTDTKPSPRLPTAASRTIPFTRSVPPDTQTLFADGMVIQHAGDVFIFSFLKTVYPLLDTLEDFANVKEIEQRCVSQVAVSIEQMARNINVFNKNFKKFLLKQEPDIRAFLNKIAELPLTEKELTQPAKKV